jgi:hypothetical protein
LSIPFVKELGLALRQQLAGSAHPPPASWAPDSAAAWLDLRPFDLGMDAASVSALAARLQVGPDVLQEVFISAIKYARGGEGAVLELTRAAVVVPAAASPDASDASSSAYAASLEGANRKAGAPTISLSKGKPKGVDSHSEPAHKSKNPKIVSVLGSGPLAKPRRGSRDEIIEPAVNKAAATRKKSPPHQYSKKLSAASGAAGDAKKSDPKGGVANLGGGSQKSKPKFVGINIDDDDDLFVVFPTRSVVKTPRATDGNAKTNIGKTAPGEDDDDYADDDFAEDDGNGDEDEVVPEEEDPVVPAPLARMQAGAQVLQADDLAAAGVQHYKSPPKPTAHSGAAVGHTGDSDEDVYLEEELGAANVVNNQHYLGGEFDQEDEQMEQREQEEEEERFPPGTMLDDLPFIDDTLTFTQEGRGGENLFSPPAGFSPAPLSPPLSAATAAAAEVDATAPARTATGSTNNTGINTTARPGPGQGGGEDEDEEEEYDWDLDDEAASGGGEDGPPDLVSQQQQQHSQQHKAPKDKLQGGDESAQRYQGHRVDSDDDGGDEYYGADDDFLGDDGGDSDGKPSDARGADARKAAVKQDRDYDADPQYDSVFEEEKEEEMGGARRLSSTPRAAAEDGYAFEDEEDEEEGEGRGEASSGGSIDYEDDDPYGDDDFF